VLLTRCHRSVVTWNAFRTFQFFGNRACGAFCQTFWLDVVQKESAHRLDLRNLFTAADSLLAVVYKHSCVRQKQSGKSLLGLLIVDMCSMPTDN
jgi:hypothetical protein